MDMLEGAPCDTMLHYKVQRCGGTLFENDVTLSRCDHGLGLLHEKFQLVDFCVTPKVIPTHEYTWVDALLFR